MRIGACTAATAMASMLLFASPDKYHELPSGLVKTPLSVPATTSVMAKPKGRTMRPSSPLAGDHVAPLSLVSTAPPPRRPARASPALNGLKTIVVGTDLPLKTGVQVDPPSGLLSSDP